MHCPVAEHPAVTLKAHSSLPEQSEFVVHAVAAVLELDEQAAIVMAPRRGKAMARDTKRLRMRANVAGRRPDARALVGAAAAW